MEALIRQIPPLVESNCHGSFGASPQYYRLSHLVLFVVFILTVCILVPVKGFPPCYLLWMIWHER